MALVKFIYRLILRIAGAPPRPSDGASQTAPALLAQSGDLFKVTVVEVLDGDTITVSRSGVQIRIRLSSIDCPENGQSWGRVARTALFGLIGDRSVLLEVYGLDVHERTLATIFLENESGHLINVNEQMVKCGHAWVAREFYGHQPRHRQRRLNELEHWARSNRVGLWKFDNPLPPWMWRKLG